jgi:hypothetical protein
VRGREEAWGACLRRQGGGVRTAVRSGARRSHARVGGVRDRRIGTNIWG